MYNEARRQTLGKRGFAYRHPNIFIFTGVTVSMCIFFSKPLYDIFFIKPPVKQEAIISDRT